LARPASVAIAGYYPTPGNLLPLIAKLVLVPPADPAQSSYSRPTYTVIDPCAGDGAALHALASAWFGANHDFQPYGVELEATRARALQEREWPVRGGWRSKHNMLHGDAFRAHWQAECSNGVDILYLNPPYDADPECKRVEQRWLARFTAALRPGSGVLLFVVPHYALAASAAFLATHYERIQCFRFPSPEFEVFKQVVLVARRSLEPKECADTERARIERWALSAASIPLLDGKPALTLPAQTDSRLYEWSMAPVDLSRVKIAVRPWQASSKTNALSVIQSVPFARPIKDLMGRPFPVAMPPRPAHIALALAAGLLNGSRIEPDDQASGLPSLLVKGVFDREYKKIEEKRDKEGNVKAIVQVQAPVLRVTVLDLTTSTYHSIATGSEPTNATTVEGFNVADLVVRYRRSLLEVLYQQCPPLHSPDRDQLELPPLSRRLFEAQRQATQGALKLLAKGENPFVLGEIGSGKSTVAAAILESLNHCRKRPVDCTPIRQVLILCPPHLLQSWEDQLRSCIPGAVVRRLETVSDVDAIGDLASPRTDAGLPGYGLVVGILSRETAKLGHPYEAVARCPSCGAKSEATDEEIVKKRLWCGTSHYQPTNAAAKLAVRLAAFLAPYLPESSAIRRVLPGPNLAKLKARNWSEADYFALFELARSVESQVSENREILYLLACASDEGDRGMQLAFRVEHLLAKDPLEYNDTEEVSRWLDLACPAAPEWAHSIIKRVTDRRSSIGWGWNTKAVSLTHQAQAFAGDLPTGYTTEKFSISKGSIRYDGELLGSVKHAEKALRLLMTAGTWHKTTCGTALYQAVPQPRRYPLATYISRRHPRLFDLLVIDEAHEYSADGSAQERAAHRLSGLGMPVVSLTGSVMNGYASSLFQNFWALSSRFREEFGPNDRAAFVQRYGYRKQLVDVTGSDKVRDRGVVTDRRETDLATVRQLGEAPGVLPLFVLQHLLPVAVTIHKADLEAELPPCTEQQVAISLGEGIGPELRKRYETLQRQVLEQIKRDRFNPEKAGKLWGALGNLPSYLDRCSLDTGTEGEPRAFVIRYPEALERELVGVAECFPSEELTPKEEWLLATLKQEFAEDRNVLLFVWHTAPESGLVQRLARLIKEHTGELPAVLDASKVGTAKRQAWIDKELIGKKRKVLIVNPVAVQTGLNNLIYCSTAIWFENPACNAIVYRQANGRLDRIGQTKPVKILFPVYLATAQQLAHELLLRKVAVSLQTDGLDAQGALEAAGAGPL
jgi:hypothetical protein